MLGIFSLIVMGNNLKVILKFNDFIHWCKDFVQGGSLKYLQNIVFPEIFNVAHKIFFAHGNVFYEIHNQLRMVLFSLTSYAYTFFISYILFMHAYFSFPLVKKGNRHF